MSEVVSLHGGHVANPGEPVPDLVEKLERLLEMARSGEIKGAVVVAVHHDEAVSTFHCAAATFRLIGALTAAATEYANDINEAAR